VVGVAQPLSGSALDEGVLPAGVHGHMEPEDPDAMSAAERATWRVVVADDDVPLRVLLRHTIQRDDRFVLVGEAGDGREALDLVSREDPDLLLLDLAMPRMGGLEVMRALETMPRPTIVVLTGLDDDLEAQSLAAGAAAYLEKGDAFHNLTERLAQALDGDQDTTIEVPTRATVRSRMGPSA
jgi:two-component system, NarL family, response regulator YdfI